MKAASLFPLALLSALATAAPRPMTVEDVVTMTSLSQPRLSPDGRRVAFVVLEADLARSRYQTDIWLVGADGSRPIPLAHSRETDRAPEWAPDGRVTFLSDRGGSTQIWIIDPAGGEATALTQHPASVGAYRWSPDGRSIAFVARDTERAEVAARRRERDDARVVGAGARHEHLWIFDVETRQTRKVTDGDYTVFDYDWSPDGKTFVIAKSTGTGLPDKFRSDLYLVDARGGELTPLVVQPGTDTIPRYSPDGRWIGFVTGQGEADWAADDDLAIVPARGGATKILSAAYDRHVEQFTWAPDSRTLYWNGPWNLGEQLFRVGIDGSGFTDLSRIAGVATGAHFLPSRDLVVYVGESFSEPPEIFISPLSRFAPRRLTDLNARYRDIQRAERRVVRWKNPQDGLEIEGILTLPLGYRDGERVPLLTFVHGGPSSQFSEEFLGYLAHVYPTHIFAARGFAVLQPNPRGSGAYGEAFRQANRADWGGGDFRDVMAGVDFLIAKGIADPERLGIMGWSYGGFLSAWAITQTDRFRAASIGAPVVDLLSMEGTSDIPGYVASFFGTVPWSAGDLIRAHNPLSHVGKVKTPALIQHGEDDPRVPFSQSQMLHQALIDLGVPVTMVAYPRTPHTAREPKLRMDVMKRNLWWFDKWINGDERPYEEWKRDFEK